MKAAKKLAQVAKLVQSQNEIVQLFTVSKKLVFTGSRKDAEEFMNQRGGTYIVKKCKYNPQEQFEKKVRWASHQYVRYVVKRCEELAKKGYGSVEIKIDCTTDLFQVDEGRISCYSHKFVVQLLQQEGFELEKLNDYYDAQSYILYWQVKPKFDLTFVPDSVVDSQSLLQEQEWLRTKLPQAPNSEKIGMCWK